MFYVDSVITFIMFLELLWKSTLLVRFKFYRLRPPQIELVGYLCTVIWRLLQIYTIR